MRKPTASIDGFIPRRSNRVLGAPELPTTQLPAPVSSAETINSNPISSPTPIRRSDIDESLNGIDEPEPIRQRRRLFGRRRGEVASHPRRRKLIKWLIVLIVLGIIGTGIFIGVKTLLASHNVFKGNPFDIFQNQALIQDTNGRSNILIFGTSEDDPGHQAPYLTDSIIVLSIDQTNKNAYIFNLPRDLQVKYGTACLSGYQGKINEVYGCHYDDGKNEDAGAAALRAKVSEVTGLDVQYSVHVNYTVVRQAVDAVGGIDITIESRDPRGQMDSNFDWKCGVGDRKVTRAQVLQRCPPSGHYIDYKNGPVHLDAEHALYLAQARGDTAPTYGFEQSNFDREKNQQKIIKALREKALSAGTLANVGKVTSLIDAIGNNLRTNFQTKEISTLVSLAKDIPSDKIQSLSLIDGDDAVMTGDGNPKAGLFQFSGIQAFIKQSVSSDPVVREKASIVVLNGSKVAGVAQTEADKLTALGLNVSDINNAPEGTYGAVEIYQLNAAKTATKQKLLETFGVTPKTTAPPFTVATGTDFVIVFGQARS